MLTIDLIEMGLPKAHHYLLGAVGPRSICFASTMDENGTPNLAPFSFFNVFSSNPPVAVFSPSRSGRTGAHKDTYNNVKKVNEVVINLVDYANIYPIFYFDLTQVKDESFTTEGACDLEVVTKCSAGTQVNFFCVVLHKRSAVISGNSTQLTLQQL